MYKKKSNHNDNDNYNRGGMLNDQFNLYDDALNASTRKFVNPNQNKRPNNNNKVNYQRVDSNSTRYSISPSPTDYYSVNLVPIYVRNSSFTTSSIMSRLRNYVSLANRIWGGQLIFNIEPGLPYIVEANFNATNQSSTQFADSQIFKDFSQGFVEEVIGQFQIPVLFIPGTPFKDDNKIGSTTSVFLRDEDGRIVDFVPFIIMTDTQFDDAFAHELGHALFQRMVETPNLITINRDNPYAPGARILPGYEQIAANDKPHDYTDVNNIMWPTAHFNDRNRGVYANPTQINKAIASPSVKRTSIISP